MSDLSDWTADLGFGMPTFKKLILCPDGGWKSETYYLVDVAFTWNNPLHRAIFYTGFLEDGKPANYNQLFEPTYSQKRTFLNAHYLVPLKEIDMTFTELPTQEKSCDK